jgi:hypothetical protein
MRTRARARKKIKHAGKQVMLTFFEIHFDDKLTKKMIYTSSTQRSLVCSARKNSSNMSRSPLSFLQAILTQMHASQWLEFHKLISLSGSAIDESRPDPFWHHSY